MEGEKCATPTIAFTNGKLTYTSETEGAEFVSSISFADANMNNSDEIVLFTVYRISVYAKKQGYLNSDVVTKDIDFGQMVGDANRDGEISIADAVRIVNIILGNADNGSGE